MRTPALALLSTFADPYMRFAACERYASTRAAASPAVPGGRRARVLEPDRPPLGGYFFVDGRAGAMRKILAMNTPTVTINDVLIVRESDLGWLCERDGHRVFVGRLQVPLGSMMPRAGTRGPISLPVSTALDLGLVDRQRAA